MTQDLPERIGPYRLVEIIGSGASGFVWRAEREIVLHDGRSTRIDEVAIKIFSRSQKTRQVLDEFEMGRRMRHNHVIGLRPETYRVRGHICCIMDLQHGRTLAQLLRPTSVSEQVQPLRRQDPLIVTEIVRQVALGLHHLHTRRKGPRTLGVVHKDIKPENLFVTRTGLVKVFDFSLVYFEGRRWSQVPGAVEGSALYLSPEQARDLDLDGQSDIFTLGTVLHELTTGTMAFRRNDVVGSMRAIVFDPSDHDVQLVRARCPALAPVVKRCWAKDPSLRYQDGWEVACALRAIQQEVQREQGLPPGPVDLRPWVRQQLTRTI